MLSLLCQRLECRLPLTDENANAVRPLKSSVKLESQKVMFTGQLMYAERGSREAERQML